MNRVSLFQYILYGLELAACITGFVYWKKVRNSFWKWFPLYLLVIVAGEQLGNYFNYTRAYYEKRILLLYFVIPLEFLFFYWLYYKNADSTGRRRLVLVCAAIYLLGFLADQLYFIDRKFFFSSFSYCVGNISLLIVIISFYIQFIKSEAIINYKSSIMFWVSLGLLVFYLGTLPFFGLLRFLHYEQHAIYVIYTDLMFICNWILYTLICVGFICGKVK